MGALPERDGGSVARNLGRYGFRPEREYRKEEQDEYEALRSMEKTFVELESIQWDAFLVYCRIQTPENSFAQIEEVWSPVRGPDSLRRARKARFSSRGTS